MSPQARRALDVAGVVIFCMWLWWSLMDGIIGMGRYR